LPSDIPTKAGSPIPAALSIYIRTAKIIAPKQPAIKPWRIRLFITIFLNECNE
jgi:hypothetical protein